MFTDEQFSKLITQISSNHEKNDLIVRMSTILEHIDKSWKEEKERTVLSINELRNSTLEAHKRINELKDSMNSYLNRFQGIVITINVVGFLAIGVINIYSKLS